MNNLETLTLLLQTLSGCNDISQDVLKILSVDLNTSILDDSNITYEQQAEGIFVDLSEQDIEIFKTKQDAIKYFTLREEKTVLILEDHLIYVPNSSDTIPIFFEKLVYAEKIKDLLISHEIISYHDDVNKKFIFLSEHIGKEEVGYKNRLVEFFDGNYFLEDLYMQLEVKLNEHEYASFFRDNFIKVSSEIENIDNRYYLSLKKIQNIYKNANREFELYKNKFSFDKFQNDLKKEKEKYIKNIQDNLSEFLSKVNALPVQFGVYILLIFRFQNEVVPLSGTIILIITWSIFSILSLNTMNKSIKYLNRKFNEVFLEISEKSGIDVGKDKVEVQEKMDNIKTMINWYKVVVIIFTLIFVVFSGSNLYKHQKDIKTILGMDVNNMLSNNVIYLDEKNSTHIQVKTNKTLTKYNRLK